MPCRKFKGRVTVTAHEIVEGVDQGSTTDLVRTSTEVAQTGFHCVLIIADSAGCSLIADTRQAAGGRV